MARFRCPTSSTEDFDPYDIPQRLASMTLNGNNHNGPQTAGPSTKDKLRSSGKTKGKGKAKAPPAMNVKQKERVRMAAKREQVKINVHGKQTNQSYVFVGNLNRSITDLDLEKLFSRCGPVGRIQIRTTSGSPETCVPLGTDTSRDKMYASIEFKNPTAVLRALTLSGRKLNGIKLVVRLSAIDLPEMQILHHQQRAKKVVPTGKQFLYRQTVNAFRRITRERTEVGEQSTMPQAGPSGHRHSSPPSPMDPKPLERRAMGISFAQTLM